MAEPKQKQPEGMNNDTKSNDSTAAVSKDELPWKQCVAGCVVPEDKAAISLSCIHSICSDECLAKMRADSMRGGLKLFCGVCNVEVEPEDLDRRVKPGEIFAEKSSPEEIVINCGNCVLDLPAVGFCYGCNIGLCQECSLHHPKVKLTQHHQIEGNLDQVRTKQFADLQKCQIYELQEANNEIEKTVNVLRALKIKSQSANQDVQEKNNELKPQWDKVNDILNVTTYQIVMDLFAQNSNLTKDVADKFLRKSASLQAYSNVIENAAVVCKRYLKACETLVNNKDMGAIIQFLERHRPVLNELKELEKEFERDYNTFVEGLAF